MRFRVKEMVMRLLYQCVLLQFIFLVVVPLFAYANVIDGMHPWLTEYSGLRYSTNALLSPDEAQA